MSDTVKIRDEFWEAYAKAFAQPIQANGLLSSFVTNPNFTGAYAEAWVRSITRSMLNLRFRISTGTVIRACDAFRDLASGPQCDLIVWDPSEMPAIFEVGEFALVPYFSARAIIEVKRSANPTELATQLTQRKQLLPAYGPLLGVVITHPKALLDQPCCPNWLEDRKRTYPPPMIRLLDCKNVPDINEIMAFIYFLAQLAGHKSTVASLRSRRSSDL